MNIFQYKTPTVLPVTRFTDERGFLDALFEGDVNASVCIKRSLSNGGVVRGFHWQKAPSPQTKLIFVLKGEIFDVTAKISDSWPDPRDLHQVKMSAEDPMVLVIPPDYAHAYQTVSPDSIVLYVCFGAYDANAELSFHPLKLGVGWPVSPPVVSKKDLAGRYR